MLYNCVYVRSLLLLLLFTLYISFNATFLVHTFPLCPSIFVLVEFVLTLYLNPMKWIIMSLTTQQQFQSRVASFPVHSSKSSPFARTNTRTHTHNPQQNGILFSQANYGLFACCFSLLMIQMIYNIILFAEMSLTSKTYESCTKI